MELATNLLFYIIVPIAVGYIFRQITTEDGMPRVPWYITGLVIGVVCGIGNAILVSSGLLFGSGFHLDEVLGPFMGGLGTGLFIGIPNGLITGYDMSRRRFTIIDGWLLVFKILILFVVIGGTVSSLAAPKYSGEQWLDFFVFGMAQGGIYALIALGYTLVYGILFMINFAHGEVFMSGAFTAFFVAQAMATPPAKGEPAFLDVYPFFGLIIVMLVAMVTSTVVAVTLERVAYRPLRRAPRLVPLITAIGASFFLQYTFRGLYGSGVEAYPEIPSLKGSLLLGDFLLGVAILIIAVVIGWLMVPLYRRLKKQWENTPSLSWAPFPVTLVILLLVLYFVTIPLQGVLINAVNGMVTLSPETMQKLDITAASEYPLPATRIQAVVIVASILLMVGLYYIVHYTKLGKAMRAVAEDKDVAALMGIDVDRIITMTFALGAVLAGAAGVLYALIFRQVHFFMGFIPGLKAFTAAVLGGIGNIPGAMLGGFFLGVFESLGPSLFLEGLGIPAPYQLKDAIAFTMLVLVLIFRPTGIMGVELSKKKA